MKVDETQLAIVVAIVLLIAIASWEFIGAFLVWAAWQITVYFVVLVVVAAILYWGLFVVAGRGGD